MTKLDGNGLWESSRMMLPEHRETIIRRQLEEGRKDKPVLDPQEMELIEQALAESFHMHRKIKVRLFDEYEDLEKIGTVSIIQTYRREIKLATGVGEWEWIKIDDIVSVC
ncbi:YolD-like family protein [Paenibacillus lautus]|uniref:YolD-like family protein n=1 Tax=Paenibacillus lautus TaxID=1401 RepID=A0A385TX84_PAELA|nr:YolD-like family protein [Paenibacillus lautus]AYB48081.1 YolD-like family protein [Paenibacillus lautus]VTR56538.1 YolD-like protein [Actinobacillus pleuropneumoniae]